MLEREASARSLLAEEGIAAVVRSAGADGEIAAVQAPPSSMVALRALVPRLRSLGYRFVAIDLTAGSTEPGGT